MTQQEFGKSIGLSTSGISRLENGRYGVTNPIKKLITEVYGVNEEWLLGKDVPVFVNDERFGDIEEFKKKIFRTLENASDDEWTVVKKFYNLFN
jgi:transcriptional regulator with XRE-family HTH domain